jgi:50S ribosomal subunit-associated GTPase HflX
MQIFLGVIASVLFCLLVYIVFFNAGLQETFISCKKKRKMLDIIDNDEKAMEEKVEALTRILHRYGKKDYIKLFNYIDKNRYNKTFKEERIRKFDDILLYLDNILCKNSHLTHLAIMIEKSLNNHDYGVLKEQIGQLKSSLVNQRYNEGFDNIYNKIASVVLAIITVLSFIMTFKG